MAATRPPSIQHNTSLRNMSNMHFLPPPRASRFTLDPPKRRYRFPQHGFTAIEVLITIAILAVLAALAGPSFKAVIERWRVRQAVEEMTSTLYYARSEAIKRGGGVGVEKKPNEAGCTAAGTGAEWGCGWFVFLDSNNNGAFNSGEPVLQTYTVPIGVDVVHNGTGGERFMVDRWGMADGINAQGFSFTPYSGNVSSPSALGICVSSGGRVRTIQDPPC